MISQELIDRLFEAAGFGRKPPARLGRVPFENNDRVATQSDKRSHTSNYSDLDMRKFARQGFPSDKFLVMFVQNTNSMEPGIDAGDVVILEKNPKDLRAGLDVCGYDEDGSIVLHRLMEIKDGGARFKGDNNFRSDPFWVPLTEVKYRCVGVLVGKKAPND